MEEATYEFPGRLKKKQILIFNIYVIFFDLSLPLYCNYLALLSPKKHFKYK